MKLLIKKCKRCGKIRSVFKDTLLCISCSRKGSIFKYDAYSFNPTLDKLVKMFHEDSQMKKTKK